MPGTGKTALITEITRELELTMPSRQVRFVSINCMTLAAPNAVYQVSDVKL